MTSRSSPPWPTSAATATTSLPVSLAIQPMATDVSRPPEYARTTRSDTVLLLGGTGWLVSAALGEPEQPAREGAGGGGRRLAGDEQDGVVAGDAAGHVGQPGAVDRGGQQVGAAGRCAQHHQRTGRLRADAQLLEHPREPCVDRLRGAGAGLAVGGDVVDGTRFGAHLHGSQL